MFKLNQTIIMLGLVLLSYSVQAAYAQPDFSGTWININPNTDENTRLEILQNGDTVTVYAWGKCVPTDCEWGAATGKIEDNSVTVVWDFGFKETTMRIVFDASNLRVETDNIYNDQRLPSSSTQFFVKEAAQEPSGHIPDWFKINVRWWLDKQIQDETLTTNIQYLIKEDVIRIPATTSFSTAQKIPDWIKKSADEWERGLTSEQDFIYGIQWMIKNGLITMQLSDELQKIFTDSHKQDCDRPIPQPGCPVIVKKIPTVDYFISERIDLIEPFMLRIPISTGSDLCEIEVFDANSVPFEMFPISTSAAVIRVIDSDMNRNAFQRENFDVDIGSSTDPGGLDLTVTETSNNSGIFEGTVFFTATDESSGHRLRVSSFDTVEVACDDSTLPEPYSVLGKHETKMSFIIGPSSTVPWSTVHLLDPSQPDSEYRAYQIPGQTFRIVCQEPCSNIIDEEVIFAQYFGFMGVYNPMLDFFGEVDVPNHDSPVDIHLNDDSICNDYIYGVTLKYSSHYGSGPNIGKPYVCIYSVDQDLAVDHPLADYNADTAIMQHTQLIVVH